MSQPIGIDLGTTNSVMAVMRGAEPEIIPNHDNKPITPSVVSARLRPSGASPTEPVEILVGDAALDNWVINPEETITSIKRLMGRAYTDPEVQRVRDAQMVQYSIYEPALGTADGVVVRIDGKEYLPQDISRIILSALKQDAERYLGDGVTHAVITVPAYFTARQKAATIEAARLAGVGVIRILEEPIAAAMALGIPTEEPSTVIVYDLGGGTFDVSFLIVAAGSFVSFGLDGDMWLGGDDFDHLLVNHIIDHIRDVHNVDATTNKPLLAALRRGARTIKEQLTTKEKSRLIIPSMLHDSDGRLIAIDMDFSRVDFERLILPLVGTFRSCQNTNSITGKFCNATNYAHAVNEADTCAKCGGSLVNAVIRDGKAISIVKSALKRTALDADQIRYVILCGNASRIPLVRSTLEEVFPNKIITSESPKECVALGAAILASRIPLSWECTCGNVNDSNDTDCTKCGTSFLPEFEDLKLLQCAPHHIGVASAGDTFNVFVYKDEPYPTATPKTQTFRTQVPGQRIIVIPIHGGLNEVSAQANLKEGEAFAILPAGLPKNSNVHIKLWLDRNGAIRISVFLDGNQEINSWVLHGLDDAGIVSIIEDAERVLVVKRHLMQPDQQQFFEQQLAALLDELSQGKYEEARHHAAAYRELARKMGDVKDETLEEKGARLIRYTEYLLSEYRWALSSAKKTRLLDLVHEVTNATKAHSQLALQISVTDLDMETDRLPLEILLTRELEFLIIRKLEPLRHDQAREFSQRLQDLTVQWRAGTSSNVAMLLEELRREVADAVLTLPQPSQVICDICHEPAVNPGDRYCINNHDLWLPKK